MMKNRGFTMTELLGVIVVLSLILLVSMPSIINTIKGNSKGQYDTFLQTIYNASEVYVVENPSEFDWTNENNSIYLENLIAGDYISGNIVNPNTNEKIKMENSVITVTKNDQNLLVFEYEYSSK
ncbi:MAG: type II secretion system protein [Bacilli bacterium]|nr:type II secretion system protein [Bacilli bacterium]